MSSALFTEDLPHSESDTMGSSITSKCDLANTTVNVVFPNVHHVERRAAHSAKGRILLTGTPSQPAVPEDDDRSERRRECRAGLLEQVDRLDLAQGEPDVVEALHQSPARVLVDLERHDEVTLR